MKLSDKSNSAVQRNTLAVCIAAFAACTATAAQADPTNQLPESTMVCLVWSGADAAGAALQQSEFGKLLQEPEVRAFWKHITRELMEFGRRRVARSGGALAPLFEPLASVAAELWTHPWTAALINLNVGSEGAADAVQAALIVEIGSDRARLKLAVEQLTALMMKARLPIEPLNDPSLSGWSVLQREGAPAVCWGFTDAHFMVTLGRETPGLVRAGARGGRSLIDSPEYRAVQAGISVRDAPAILTIFVDVKRLRARLLSPTGPLGMPRTLGVLGVIQALGLETITGIGAATFAAKNGFRHAMFLHAEGPKRGLMSLFDQPPLREADLYPIPSGATFFYATNLDALGLINELVGPNGTDPASPDSSAPRAPFLSGLFDTDFGRALREELLPALGDTWLFFDAPSNGGIVFTGVTLCVETKNARQATTALKTIVTGLIREAGLSGARVRTAKGPAGDVFFLQGASESLPFAPAWGANERWLVAALYPQMVRTALSRLATDDRHEPSILNDPAYQRAAAQLPGDANAIFYQDTASLGRNIYALLVAATPMLSAELQRMGANVDAALIPPASALFAHVGPTISATQCDSTGVRIESHASLPLVSLSVPEAVVLSPFALSIAIPAMNRASETTQRTESAARLKQLGMACIMYAVEHDDRLPDSLDELVPYLGNDRSLLTAPHASSDAASYALVPNLPPRNRIPAPSTFVMIYENPFLQDGKNVNVCYADGHVAWQPVQALRRELDETARAIEQIGQPPQDAP